MSLNSAELFNVNGLVAVITGGGTGIGLMMARALALNGAHKVYIIGRREEALKRAAATVDTGNIIPLVGDVTSKDSLQSIAQQISDEVGYVNLVIANSGVEGPKFKITDEMSIEEVQAAMWGPQFDEYLGTFGVNVAAVWFTLAAFMVLLDKGNKKGNVEQKSQFIATTSIGGFHRSNTGIFSYGQSKAAVTHMIKQLSTSLYATEIRFNAIAPGYYPSEMAAATIKGREWTKKDIPLQRVGTEEDMAGVLLFLTSKAGAYIDGNIVVTDGGRLSILHSTY